MKNAAKGDMQCELQNSASHQIFERNRRLRAISQAGLFQCVFLHHLNSMRLNNYLFNFSLVKDEYKPGLVLAKEAVTFYK